MSQSTLELPDACARQKSHCEAAQHVVVAFERLGQVCESVRLFAFGTYDQNLHRVVANMAIFGLQQMDDIVEQWLASVAQLRCDESGRALDEDVVAPQQWTKGLQRISSKICLQKIVSPPCIVKPAGI
jgi:hypothetical protein